VELALRTLHESGIRAAPIRRTAGTNDIVGFVDHSDILHHLLTVAGDGHAHNAPAFFNALVKDIAGSSGRNPYVAMPLSSTLLDVAEALTRRENKALRVAIVDAAGLIVKVISPSTIIKFVIDRLTSGLVCDKLNRPLSEVGYCDTVVSVNPSMKAREALALMNSRHFSGMPVVNVEEGKLISNISARDIKIFAVRPDLSILNAPLMDIVSQSRQMSVKDMFPYVCCKSSDTFDAVLRKVSATNVHRIMVVDPARKPVGIVTQHMLLATLVR